MPSGAKLSVLETPPGQPVPAQPAHRRVRPARAASSRRRARRSSPTIPIRLIRVFRHCQQLGCTLGFQLSELIRESLALMTNIAHSADAAVCFRSILSEVGAVHPTLAKMHELGVLGRFVPEFDALTCYVQHEFYHRYTADVHTLNAIRELDLIFAEAEPITAKYRAVLHEIADPALIYLTLLLHDIGKAEGIKGHAESGVRLAAPILERLAVSRAGTDLVLFVIKESSRDGTILAEAGCR